MYEESQPTSLHALANAHENASPRSRQSNLATVSATMITKCFAVFSTFFPLRFQIRMRTTLIFIYLRSINQNICLLLICNNMCPKISNCCISYFVLLPYIVYVNTSVTGGGLPSADLLKGNCFWVCCRH